MGVKDDGWSALPKVSLMPRTLMYRMISDLQTMNTYIKPTLVEEFFHCPGSLQIKTINVKGAILQ